MSSYIKKFYRLMGVNKTASVMLIAVMVCLSATAVAQQNQPIAGQADTTAKPLLKMLKKLNVSGTIRSRFVSSLHGNIDDNGLQHSSASTALYATNAFTIPQARLVVAGDVTDKLDVYFRANFASSNANNIMEYAYATYHFNPYLNVRVGQFRPEFGKEDDIATDFLQSFDYSNQYNAFADNGWVSYQLGASILGEVKALGFPVKYAVGVFNGNGRTSFTDNDNGKQFPARVELDFTPEFSVGLNVGIGKSRGNHVSAWGADVDYEKQLSQRFYLSLVSEYKQGNNQSMFFDNTEAGTTFNQYMMRGAYVLPSLQYKIHSKEVKGLEASFKYEYMDPAYKLNGNVRQQYVPMLGIDFAEKYAVRLQVGMLIDRYDRNIENTTEYNSSRFITQLQVRF